MVWMAGLRGVIAFICALGFPNEAVSAPGSLEPETFCVSRFWEHLVAARLLTESTQELAEFEASYCEPYKQRLHVHPATS